ncbi:hypothetical protein D9M71_826980 [compost metagenome]
MKRSNSTTSGASSPTKRSKLLSLRVMACSAIPRLARSAVCSPMAAGLLKVMRQPRCTKLSRICIMCEPAAEERGSGQT